MLGRTNTGGGGSGGLNFQVIGGTTAPSNPKENMIWVNTSTKITSYIFSATQPTGSAGMVWISTGTSSHVAFNALKKNGIQVYPLAAKQYISGAWVSVTAQTYQDGEWSGWLTTEYLVQDGNAKYAFSKNDAGVSIKTSSGYYVFTASGGGYWGMWATADLTGYNTVKTDGVFYPSSEGTNNYTNLCVWPTGTSNPIWSNAVAKTALTTSGATLDVSSLSGSYYVGLSSTYTYSQKISNLYIEP